jgi:NADH-quinone oxidoreductase subunit L
VEPYLFLIPLLPFLGFLVNGLMGARMPRRFVSFVACGSSALAALIAFLAFRELLVAEGRVLSLSLGDWIRVGELKAPFAFVLDRLSGVMVLVVTGIGTLIHVYSTGYMRDDPGYPRFFAYLNLFMAAMLVLVLADNIVLLFLGWEGVGLCSYLLIGFWYKDLSNCSAGMKAFVVNRIGDFGFILGIFLIYIAFGSFQFTQLNAAAAGQDRATLFWIGLLLFIGATGKSAQIPLHVWLPDAMAGPTPVSALIHAATMVTSGVYMVARLGPLYQAAPGVLPIIATVGALTALLAALIALTQTDIKKVLAYSTVSQLGYMFLAAGMGAFSMAIFHLVTHAFFKALLFLGAGAVIHSLHHEQDMTKMGGLWKKMPRTGVVFLIGALALAGFPLTSGFFSKDEILDRALHLTSESGGWFILWALGFATAILTAFYAFRQVSLVFFGEYRGRPSSGEGDHHAPAPGAQAFHEPPSSMMVPLYLLAALALVGGFFPVPAFLGKEASEGSKILGWLLGSLAAVSGVGAALYLFIQAPSLRLRIAEGSYARAFLRLSFNKFYVDELYERLILKPFQATCLVLYYFIDRALIDWLAVSGTALFVRAGGVLLRKLQSGRVPSYAVVFMAGVVGLLTLLLWASG